MTRRTGLSFLETLLAAVMVISLAGLSAGAVWQWSRAGARMDVKERALAAASGRLEMLTALPLHRRPVPGTYTHDPAQEDLARVLEPRDLGRVRLDFELVVEENPVEYVDYFFEGSARVRHLDFRRFRLFARGGDQTIELVTLR